MTNLEKLRENFFKNGFIIVRKMFSKTKIKTFVNELHNVKIKSTNAKNKHIHFTYDNRVNSIHGINNYINSGTIADLAKNKKLLNIVSSILGSKPLIRNIELFLKPKKTGLRVPFHQDNYYWKIKNKKAVNVWIACAESNRKNGVISYYLKSHKNGLYKHVLTGEPGSSQKIPDKYLKKIKLKKIYPRLKSGDCIVHHCETVHGSDFNKSNKDRAALVISYKSKEAIIDREKIKQYKKLVKKNLQLLKQKRKYED